ncbi:MAG TPA: glycosyltransferase [Actinocrinis sp.]|nr:glycosyltransferase [Actinocrinis sp.]
MDTVISAVQEPAGTCASPEIRVASVPAGHVYVQHLEPTYAQEVVRRLPDPRPCGAPVGSQQWWPPVMLDPAWVRANRDAFDVFHVHFGFDAQTPQQLADLVAELRRWKKPLVYTVHDLENPHHREPEEHRRQLDVLVPAADHLITLTPGAADRIQTTWGRRATVLPHPHVVDLPRIEGARPTSDVYTVAVHAKSIRPNMAPLPVIEVIAQTVADLPQARLRVDIHPEIEDPASYWYEPTVLPRLRKLAESGALKLHVHDYFSDDQLWDYLQSVDLSVLPYRFGTHSGWLEACYDLGTAVCAPSCGYYAQQRPCMTYGHDRSGLDEESLDDAVRTAYRERPQWRASASGRATERDQVGQAHHGIYRSLRR